MERQIVQIKPRQKTYNAGELLDLVIIEVFILSGFVSVAVLVSWLCNCGMVTAGVTVVIDFDVIVGDNNDGEAISNKEKQHFNNVFKPFD